MYALAARDKLHKREKEEYEHRHSPRVGKSNGKRHKVKEERPTSVQKEARYVGTFLMESGKKADFVKIVKHQLSRVNPKDPSHALLHVSLLINMEGIKAISYDTHDVVMAHSLRKILYCTSESKKHLFAIVTMDAQDGNEKVFTHVFVTAKKDQANELNQIVSKAFKVHFARTTIARERKLAAKQSSMSQAQRTPDQRARRQRSTSPQPATASSARGHSSSPQPPVNSNPPPYNPNMVPRSTGRIGGGVSDSALQHRPPQSGLHGGHSSSHISSAPPPAPAPVRKSWAELTQESSVMEQEIESIQTRLAEIAEQKQELAGFEEAITQLVAQETPLRQQLESKRRQLGAIQFQLQDAAVQEFSHMHLQPPQAVAAPSPVAAGFPGEPPPYSPSMSPTIARHNDPLPDFSLEEASWFHEGIPRDIAMEILAQQPEGSFMVRNSSSNPGCYALTMKGPQGQIHHFLIQALPNGYKLQTSGLVFPTVVDLIHSYTVHKDVLPCVLELSATNPMGMNGDDHGFDSDDEFSQFQNAEYRLLP